MHVTYFEMFLSNSNCGRLEFKCYTCEKALKVHALSSFLKIINQEVEFFSYIPLLVADKQLLEAINFKIKTNQEKMYRYDFKSVELWKNLVPRSVRYMETQTQLRNGGRWQDG